ncbi:hypothetical protein RMAECT_0344 [Rickettsia rhipicephali str. Ect]|uniref:Uncharacterized protein n=1 Tax=Rickettsia rhipicephali str. Ect TaxID=1359199 RepID=A0A0F3PGE8_RICRH|nr:hypothetical protein RMAECT_0344 [Rickettsia rhipicephali str. Ect]
MSFFRHGEANYEVIDEAISGICYYFMRLPHSLRSLAMTVLVFNANNISTLCFSKQNN